MILKGKIGLRDEEGRLLLYTVVMRDNFSDTRLSISIDGGVNSSLYEASMGMYDKQDGEMPEGYNIYAMYDLGGATRRLEIKKTNKYKTNIPNREMCGRISAIFRYMQIAGKSVNPINIEGEFSNKREVRVEDTNGEYIGRIIYEGGLISEIECKTPYIEMDMRKSELTKAEQGLFQELKEKDKWGNVVSPTPVSTVGFKLEEGNLGFEYISEAEKGEDTQAFGMYETIEDVIANNPGKNTDWIKGRRYEIVTDENLEDVIEEFKNHKGKIAFDTETSGLRINFKSRTNEADQLVGVVLSKQEGEGYYFPLQHKQFANLCGGDHHFFMERYMRGILEKKDIICHNLKFDWKVAHIYDINVNVVYDTMIALGVTKLYEDKTYSIGLKQNVKNIFGYDMFDLGDFVQGGSFSDSDIAFWDLPYELVRQYAPADTDMTYKLYNHFENTRLLEQYDALKVFEMEVTFAKAVSYSEFYGYHIDVENIEVLKERIADEREREKQKMFELAGQEFNPNSPTQLLKIMYEDLGIEKVGKKLSTDKETLKTLSKKKTETGELRYPFVNHLKAYRDYEGTNKNFLKKLHLFATEDGYIFPDVMQLGTTTGRCSVKNPNYQSYNDVVKEYITPREGYIHLDSDFAQIEYRVLASMSKQEQLIEAFNDVDLDYHTHQAARMHGVPYASVSKELRQQSKGINFGLPYGMGDNSLGAVVFGARTKENEKKAGELRKRFFQGQEKIQEFFERVRKHGVDKGYTSTHFGRRRYYNKSVFTEAAIRRQAGNHVIQGTAADIYKEAVNKLFERICKEGWLGKVLINAFVHDEVLLEVHESIDPYEFTKIWRDEFEVKLDGFCQLFAGMGYGKNWVNAKKLDLHPMYIEEVIQEGLREDRPEWDGDHTTFLKEIEEGFIKHKIKRVSEYIEAKESQGEVIKPAIGSLLSEEIDRIVKEKEKYKIDSEVRDIRELVYTAIAQGTGMTGELAERLEREIKRIVKKEKKNWFCKDLIAQVEYDENGDYKGVPNAMSFFCEYHRIPANEVGLTFTADEQTKHREEDQENQEYLELLSKCEKDKDGNIRVLDEQLDIFCKYHKLDKSSIDIKSPDFVKVEDKATEESGGGYVDEYGDEDYYYTDQAYNSVEMQEKMEEVVLLSGLSRYGIVVDTANRVFNIANMTTKVSGKPEYIIQKLANKQLLTAEGGDYAIVYHSNIMGEMESKIVTNYRVESGNIEAIKQLVATWLNVGGEIH